MDVNVKLDKSMSPTKDYEREDMKCVPCQEAVGSLFYAAQGTRPDISYVVNMVSSYSKNKVSSIGLQVRGYSDI